jgi:hypothetical protein
VRLRTRGARAVTVHAGRTARLTVAGRYESGAAELSWTHDGRLVALWDFNIELDQESRRPTVAALSATISSARRSGASRATKVRAPGTRTSRACGTAA